MPKVTCYIGIGSNLGDRRGYIDRAVGIMESSSKIILRRMSSIYETDPVGEERQGKFLNGVIEIETGLSPRQLMAELSAIEKTLGRERRVKNGPRTIDLDILYYGNEAINDSDLMIPHPRIQEREFVLKGLRELNKA